MLLKLNVMPSMDEWKSMVKELKGNLLLRTTNQEYFEVNKDQNVEELFEEQIRDKRKLEVYVNDTIDYFTLVNFMIGCGYGC